MSLLNMSNDYDDIWMKSPVNYTPWFKWLIKKREEINNQTMPHIEKLREKKINKDLFLDLYLVEYNKDDGQFKSNLQRQKEGMKNRYFLDDDEISKLLEK